MSDDADKKAAEFFSNLHGGIRCEHDPKAFAVQCWECGPNAIAAALREAYDHSPERIRTLMAERYGASSACDILQAEIAKLKEINMKWYGEALEAKSELNKLKAELEAAQRKIDTLTEERDSAYVAAGRAGLELEQAAERQREKDAEIARNLCQSAYCDRVTGTSGFCIACQVRNAILAQEVKK